MKAKWNDSCSDSFPLFNGVKQGAVLFTIYMPKSIVYCLTIASLNYYVTIC